VVGSRHSLHGEHEYDVGVAPGKVTAVETQREGGGPQRGGNVSNSHRGAPTILVAPGRREEGELWSN
jgi:hypothetical protein